MKPLHIKILVIGLAFLFFLSLGVNIYLLLKYQQKKETDNNLNSCPCECEASCECPKQDTPCPTCPSCPPSTPCTCPPCAPTETSSWYNYGPGLIPSTSRHQEFITSETDTLEKAQAWVQTQKGTYLSYPIYVVSGAAFYWRDCACDHLTLENNPLYLTYQWQ